MCIFCREELWKNTCFVFAPGERPEALEARPRRPANALFSQSGAGPRIRQLFLQWKQQHVGGRARRPPRPETGLGEGAQGRGPCEAPGTQQRDPLPMCRLLVVRQGCERDPQSRRFVSAGWPRVKAELERVLAARALTSEPKRNDNSGKVSLRPCGWDWTRRRCAKRPQRRCFGFWPSAEATCLRAGLSVHGPGGTPARRASGPGATPGGGGGRHSRAAHDRGHPEE